MQVSKFLLVVLGSLLITACSDKQEVARAMQAEKTKQVEVAKKLVTEKLKAQVANNLTDPSSAQFRNLILGLSKDGDNLLCGEINGKNQFGGYAGYRWFAIFERGGGEILEPNMLSEAKMKAALNKAGCGYQNTVSGHSQN